MSRQNVYKTGVISNILTCAVRACLLLRLIFPTICDSMNDDCDTTTKETFQEPRKKFWLRSRKRPKRDSMNISSMDTSMDSYMGNKRKRSRIMQFTSQIFQSSTAVSKLDNIMHRSFIIPPNWSDLSINEDEADTGVLRKKLKNATTSYNNLRIKS